jgi:hypothetical protein
MTYGVSLGRLTKAVWTINGGLESQRGHRTDTSLVMNRRQTSSYFTIRSNANEDHGARQLL